MGVSMGSGYFGSTGLVTTTANMELIQQHKPSEWTTGFMAYKFNFMNYQDCHIKINGDTNQIFIPAQEGFSMNEVDRKIMTFIVVEANITINYVGAF